MQGRVSSKIYGARNHPYSLVQQHVAELLDCITCNCVCSQHKCNICIFHIYPHGQIVTFVHKSCLSATGCRPVARLKYGGVLLDQSGTLCYVNPMHHHYVTPLLI